MAYENIQIRWPNFCHGPQDATMCTINQDTATTLMRIKTSAGGLIADYTLSSNIINKLLHLEYVGPMNLTGMIDGLTFFTVERISSSRIIIKRWETRASSNQLNLKHQIIKYDTGSYYYDINSAAVEYYRRIFSDNIPAGSNYIKMNSAGRLTSGTKLFLGPSDDADNIGKTETVVVSYISGGKVYLTTNTLYDYVIGDSVCFYVNVYLYSNMGAGGDASQGTIFKINAYTGNVDDLNTDKFYQNITAARWSEDYSAVASVSNDNMLFVRPYNGYQNWKSMFMNTIEADNYNRFELYDVLFEGYAIYKLMHKVTLRDNDGNKTTHDWGSWYNYRADTILPYTNSIQISTDKAFMIGPSDTTTFNIKVIDQFGVGLRDKTVKLYKNSGDIGAAFNPTNGQVTTDINGEATVGYTSTLKYTGVSVITCEVDGSSTTTGSEKVWNSIRIYSEVGNTDPLLPLVEPYAQTDLFQLKEVVSDNTNPIKQIPDEVDIHTHIRGRTFFTTPGGDWVNPTDLSDIVPNYLPGLLVGEEDGPAEGFSASGPRWDVPSDYHLKSNQITQVWDFESEYPLYQVGNFKSKKRLVWNEETGKWYEVWSEPYFSMYQKEESGEMTFSQLKLSYHTYWQNYIAYDEAWAELTPKIDQFVFVEDAIPKFWSAKNPTDTNIWIRLRPAAESLNALTLTYLIREVWSEGDTNYVDVSSQVSYQYFDAGGSVQGVELTYDPPQDFHHDSVVYVQIHISDIAYIPNRISTSYWFMVIPDYKSPYLKSMSPSREQSNVAVDSNVSYEVKDDGAGVDIDSLEMTINSRRAIPTTITRVTDNHYQVEYVSASNFYYGKRITVTVKVKDTSSNDNWLNDRYSFYTAESDDVLFTNFEPELCKKGLPRFHDVSFVALAAGDNIDRRTLRLQVHDYDVTNESRIVPVIYRIS